MSAAAALCRLLPHPMPGNVNARLALFAIRRLGAHGLGDAQTSYAFMTAFGAEFRRPLILMRVMMAEIAAVSTVAIEISPCCCTRMTAAEAGLMIVMIRAPHQPQSARLLLADLLGNRRADGVFTCVCAVTSAFADGGRSIGV